MGDFHVPFRASTKYSYQQTNSLRDDHLGSPLIKPVSLPETFQYTVSPYRSRTISSSNSLPIVSVTGSYCRTSERDKVSRELSAIANRTITAKAMSASSMRPENIPEVLDDIVPEVTEMPGDEWDHRRRRPKVAFNQRTAKYPCGMEDFLQNYPRLLQSRRFAVIPLTRNFQRGSSYPQTRAEAWKAHWLHRGPCFDVPNEECDVAYLRTRGEWSYQILVSDIRNRFLGSTRVTSPSLSLVGFPKPFTGFHMFNRERRGDDAAFESRMRNKDDGHFVTYDHVEYFAVPIRERDELYVRVDPSWRHSWEPPRFLCVPTPPYMAYYSSDWLAEQSSERKILSDLIFKSEWVVLCFICFLDAAKTGLRFKTRCMDNRLYQKDSEGGYGRLFHLPDNLMKTIEEMHVSEIVSGTVYDPKEAQRALDAVKEVNWKKLPEEGFAFYNFALGRFLEMPEVDWPYTYSAEIPLSDSLTNAGHEASPLRKAPRTGLLLRSPVTPCEQTVSNIHYVSRKNDPYNSGNYPRTSTASPSFEPSSPLNAVTFFSEEEQQAFSDLQQECVGLNKSIPQTVAEAFRMATLWARDSSRLAHIENQATGLLHLAQETESGLHQLLRTTHRTQEDYHVSGIQAPSKRPRTS